MACGKDDPRRAATADDRAGPGPAATATATATTPEVRPRSARDGCKAVPAPEPSAQPDRSRSRQKLSAKRTYTAILRTNCGTIRIRLDVKTLAEDDRLVRGPRAQQVLRRADVSPDRQAGRQRLRHPGRRPAGHRQRRSRLHRRRARRRSTRATAATSSGWRRRRRAPGHLGQPVLHRHRGRGAAARRLRDPRPRDRRQERRAPHRAAGDRPGDGDADRSGRDELGAGGVLGRVGAGRCAAASLGGGRRCRSRGRTASLRRVSSRLCGGLVQGSRGARGGALYACGGCIRRPGLGFVADREASVAFCPCIRGVSRHGLRGPPSNRRGAPRGTC